VIALQATGARCGLRQVQSEIKREGFGGLER
jgi:hypothetical protein